MELGLDMWWYDRNWSTKLKSPAAGVKPEALGMYLFSEITDHFYRKKNGEANPSRRPDIMANVNEVTNGTYIGIRDSASHRYSIQWTGDIGSDGFSLAQESIRSCVLRKTAFRTSMPTAAGISAIPIARCI